MIAMKGRRKIFSDITVINEKNIFRVLDDALMVHFQNVSEIQYLLNYEKGIQPLSRTKKIRKDIDIKVCDNVANQVTEFKLGYNWGNPITLVQRGKRDLNGSDSNTDDTAVGMLNEMLDDEYVFSKDQELARYIEVTGIGTRFVDIKKTYDGGSVFDIYTLNPLHSFVVYANDVTQRPVMGCMYRKLKNGNIYFTCFTNERRYEIKNYRILNAGAEEYRFGFRERSGEVNPLGEIPIIEYVRSYDRMGCFERQISDMDSLNILVSDFANQVSQTTQTIWWGNDVELPQDEETKKAITPESGEWVMTTSPSSQNAKPDIKPLSATFDYAGIESDIQRRRDTILQKCDVPLRTEPGGGSTGSAMSMSSGWSSAEVAACKEAQIIRRSRMQELRLILKVIGRSTDIPAESPLRELKISDIEPQFKRNKTYDMITKVNAYATLIGNMVDGRHALKVIDLFSDPQQVWNDSKDRIEAFQDSKIKSGQVKNNTDPEEEIKENLIDQDLSDQINNSPIIGG